MSRTVSVISVCFAAGVLTTIAGCNPKTASGQLGLKDAGNQPVLVETIRPTREDLKRFSDSTPAELLPYEQTDITAKIAGYVQKVNVDYGDRVKGPRYDCDGKLVEEGQVLAELWMPELVAKSNQKEELIKQATADVKQATANLAAAEANVKTAEAAVKEAEAARGRAEAQFAFARGQHERLSKTGQVIERQVIEEALNQKIAAEAARAEIEAKVQSMKAACDELDSFSPLGNNFDTYVDALIELNRRNEVPALIEKFRPYWDHNLGYGKLGSAAFKSGHDQLAEAFILRLRHSMKDWFRSEEINNLANVWHRQGRDVEAHALLIDALKGLLEQSRDATGRDITSFEDLFQGRRAAYLRIFPGKGNLELQRHGIPSTTLEQR
jgi:hypothetical protein